MHEIKIYTCTNIILCELFPNMKQKNPLKDEQSCRVYKDKSKYKI